MAERKISNDRKRITSCLLHDQVPHLLRVIALVEVAENQPSYPIQHPRQFEVGQQSIQPIQGFSAIFKEEQSPLQIGKIGRSQELTETGEIAAEQRPRGHAMPQDWPSATLQENS